MGENKSKIEITYIDLWENAHKYYDEELFNSAQEYLAKNLVKFLMSLGYDRNDVKDIIGEMLDYINRK